MVRRRMLPHARRRWRIGQGVLLVCSPTSLVTAMIGMFPFAVQARHLSRPVLRARAHRTRAYLHEWKGGPPCFVFASPGI